MKLTNRIICTLDIERGASIERLASLVGADRQRVYRATYALCGRGLVKHPRPRFYRLSDIGLARARVILAEQIHFKSPTKGS